MYDVVAVDHTITATHSTLSEQRGPGYQKLQAQIFSVVFF